MAITRIQQSQISGSLSYSLPGSLGSGLMNKGSLAQDLDALRALVKDIKGSAQWYDASSQDLAKIYAAVRMTGANADFQGTLDVTGAAILDSSLAVAGASSLASLAVSGETALNGGLNMDSGKFTVADGSGNVHTDGAMDVSGAGTFASTLAVSGQGSFSSGLTVAQGFTSSYAAIGGGYGSSGVSISAAGDVQANGALTVDGASYLSGSVAAASLAVAGNETVGGTLGVTGAATFSSSISAASAAISGNETVGGTLGVTGAATFSSTLQAASIASTGAMSSAGNFSVNSNKFTVNSATGAAVVSGSLQAASLAITGPAVLNSTLGVTGAATFSSSASVAGALSVSGQINASGGISAANVVSAGSGSFVGALSAASAAISGNETVGGTLGVTGAATFGGGITVNSAVADFNAGVTANSIKIDGDVEGYLYRVASDGSIKDEGNLFYSGAGLQITGSLDVSSGLKAASAIISGNETVGGTLSVAQSISAGTSLSSVTFSSSGAASVGGQLTVSGLSSLQALEAGASTLSSLTVTGNAQVNGDLLVKGSTTYIQTDNMIVKDAFIHLATGSAGSDDSGIVLHKGDGSSDLIIGQNGGVGELIFASKSVDAAVDSSNAIDLAAAALVPAWMSQAKIGAAQGSMVGSISKSGSDFLVAAESGSELKLQSAGNAAVSFASASQVPTGFSASTVVGMLNELRSGLSSANAGGNLSKAAYSGSVVAGGVLSFAAQGSLASASHKLVDVFLNGVLLAPGYDLTGVSTTSVTMSSDIASALIADDVFTVVIRG